VFHRRFSSKAYFGGNQKPILAHEIARRPIGLLSDATILAIGQNTLHRAPQKPLAAHPKKQVRTLVNPRLADAPD
jgi:hypothetical protein